MANRGRGYNPRDKHVPPKLHEKALDEITQESQKQIKHEQQQRIEADKIAEEVAKEVKLNNEQNEMAQKIAEEFKYAKSAMKLEDIPVVPPKETKVIESVQPKKEEPKKPVYSFSKENGQVKIESVESPVVKEQKEKISKKQSVLAKMLINISEEIIKTEIEIEIHNEIIKGAMDLAEQHNIQRKIISYHNNLEYLTNKKNILIKMVKSSV